MEWAPGAVTGAPLLVDGLAWLECSLETIYDGGDHSIAIGRVRDGSRGGERDPLLFFGGGYHRLG
jgi:flavin reductase (DIM6/NTAB) family NADH-FMN oxidoreductase RutF